MKHIHQKPKNKGYEKYSPKESNTEKKIYNTGTFLLRDISEKWYYGIIFIVSFILYFSAIFFVYVDFDDSGYIVEQQAYFSEISNLWKGFVHSKLLDYYRPVLFGSFIIDFQIGKTSPLFYHVSNILYHILACCLLYKLLRVLHFEKVFAFLTTLLFTVHPLFAQAVAWIFGRNDSLLSIFILLSLIYFFEFLQKKKIFFYFLHLFFFLFAFFTKETTMGLPIVCGLYVFLSDSFVDRKEKRASILLLCFGWICVILIWYVFRWYAFKEASQNGYITADIQIGFESFVRNLPIVVDPLTKFFFPFFLSTWASFSVFSTVIGICLYLCIFLFLYKEKFSFKSLLWILVWWMIFLLPSAMVFIRDGHVSDYLEHRTYLPAISWIILLNIVFAAYQKKGIITEKRMSFIVKIGIGLCIILGILAYIHSNNFRNAETFWGNAAKTSPQHRTGWRSLGKYYFDNQKFDLAKKNLLQAYRIDKTEYAVQNAIGVLYYQEKKYDSAKMFFEETLQMNPTHVDANYYLGSISEMEKQNTRAKKFYKQSYNANNQKYEALYNIAALYQGEKNDSASLFYKKAIAINPNLWQAYYALSTLSSRKMHYDSARIYISKTLEINPQLVEGYFSLAIIAYNTGNIAEYETALKKCIEINPDFLEAYKNLVDVYIYKNEIDDAQKYLAFLKQRGIDLSAQYPNISF
ncbi:MAG: glycosyltransferase family 39 protein [Chitinophagaceae bacterium]|nr:glycosyltransferase family 39 protein [Chitinophagaceae bacterium]